MKCRDTETWIDRWIYAVGSERWSYIELETLKYRDTENLNTSSSTYRTTSKKRKHDFI